ncbi:hypothetical protein BH582_12135 [Vibrio sp. 10N.222.47.A9]|uniref:ATP-grasp fold amidoligase family protein n=1 Tax=Vibrio sp. 10N.222.47.A9 TaxID=1903178 RepID=UPI000977F2CD|nr:ATP-grasp fold amidoligase family protein [Vibrio sp. 10N.222.47.A9]OMO31691.1 hypothetical protein BH582_12135 [Vibrio sp. 10N.222.47.A9]
MYFKNILKFIIKSLPLSSRIRLMFLFKHKFFLSFSTPKLFSEKIQARKLSDITHYAMLSDKFAVRDYVKRTIGSEYLIPLLWSVDGDEFDSIPDLEVPAVIKTNHGSGLDHIEFLPSKKSNIEIVSKFKSALCSSYAGELYGEVQYSSYDRKVIIEQRLGNLSSVPHDFKFHVFTNDGSPRWFLQVDFGRYEDHHRNYYDSNLNLLDLQVLRPNGKYCLPAKKELDFMAELAIKLCGEMSYARVDLYLVDGDVYFGEITLTPGSGFEKFSSRHFEIEWGSLWK